MRPIHLILVILFFLSNDIFCQNKESKSFLAKQDFLQVSDGPLYMHQSEISNRQYHEFLNWKLKNEGLAAYHLMFPDTTVWKDKLTYSEPLINHYFQHPAFLDFPVVGVSWQQAVAWCNWKADRLMESAQFKKSGLKEIRLRLPSEKEWMAAARGGLPETTIYPWPGNSVRMVEGKKRDIGKCLLNITIDSIANSNYAGNLPDPGFITTHVASYWPNNIGLYNICGNVAEWIQEKNMAKGGSWNSRANNARIDAAPETVPDSGSSSTIGFRPVLEIVSYKNGTQLK